MQWEHVQHCCVKRTEQNSVARRRMGRVRHEEQSQGGRPTNFTMSGPYPRISVAVMNYGINEEESEHDRDTSEASE